MIGGIKVNCVLCVILLKEGINSNVQVLLHGLYGLNGPWCQLSEKGKRNQSLTYYLPYTHVHSLP